MLGEASEANTARGPVHSMPNDNSMHALGTKSCRSIAEPPNQSLLAQLVSATNSSTLARQIHPKLLEGLEAALSALEPLKSADAHATTEQLFLKAFRNSPDAMQTPSISSSMRGLWYRNLLRLLPEIHPVESERASSELQQILACNSEAAAAILTSALQQPAESLLDGNGVAVKKSLGPGDYVVLQTPVMSSPTASPKKMAKKSKLIKLPETGPAGTSPVSSPASTSRSSNGETGRDEIQKAADCISCGSQTLVTELHSLRKHKEWADKKIDQLIKRVRDSEGPQRLLTEEVQQLRLEKDSVETKLKDFEMSLQKLKDCTYTEAAQRQEYELTLRQVQAELRGASLREQEVQASIRNAQTLLRQEKKRRESLEKRFQKAVEEKADLQASATDAISSREAAEEGLRAAKESLRLQLLEVQKARDAAFAAELEAKAAKTWAAEVEQRLVASEASSGSRIEELEGVVAALNAQLDEASSHTSHTDHSDQDSFYSHFEGKAIFGGSSFWLQDPVVSATGDLRTAKPQEQLYGSVMPRFGGIFND